MYNNPNNETLSQREKVLVVMLRGYNEDAKIWWQATDFQMEKYGVFIGYEASARISELVKDFPFAFETTRNGRFRVFRFRFENAREIYNILPNDLKRHLVREKIII